MIFLNDIKQYLQKKGITYPIYVLNLPAKPNNCITLFEYEGLPSEIEAQTVSPGLQLLLRVDNADIENGYEQIYKAVEILEQIGFEGGELPEGVTINNTQYLNVVAQGSGLIPLGKDDNGCNIFTKNFYVTKER